MQDTYLVFLTDRIRQEWESPNLDKTLRNITEDASIHAAQILGWHPTITCIWRAQGEDQALGGTGIHYYWRAIDLRTKDVSQPQVDALVAYVNGRYVYDATRPQKVVAYGKPHGSGPHLHLQVCAGNKTGMRPTPREV
jgi:hypothetical protein